VLSWFHNRAGQLELESLFFVTATTAFSKLHFNSNGNAAKFSFLPISTIQFLFHCESSDRGNANTGYIFDLK
jgi:hypothetical protein